MVRSFAAAAGGVFCARAVHPWALGAALFCGVGLAGCVGEPVAQAPAVAAPRADNIAPRPGVSPAGASVAVASIAGAPGDLNDRFEAQFAAAAKRDDVSVADGKADYLVRTYLSAYPEGDGTAVSCVLDIFDARKHRTQRVTEEVAVRGQAADSWSLVNDQVLAAVAAKSASALAAVMTNTPEAIAANSAPQPPQGAPPQSGKTVVAASGPPSPPAQPAPPHNTYGMAALR